MICWKPLLRALAACREGAVVIEVAVLAPVLVLLGLGTVEVSTLVSRQSELQSALAEAAAITLASTPDTDAKIETIKAIISASANVNAANIAITTTYRCGTDTTYVTLPGYCTVTGEISKYLQITVNETYTPYWTKFGVSKPVQLSLTRTIQIS